MPDHGTGKETEEEIKMACFLVPAAEAAVVTAAAQVVKMKEKKKGTAHTAEETAIPFSRKLQWLCNLLWGASLMWLVDAIFEYAELHAEYFTPAPMDMLNDFFLGLSVVALGLIVWLVVLLIKDPKGVVKATLLKKK